MSPIVDTSGVLLRRRGHALCFLRRSSVWLRFALDMQLSSVGAETAGATLILLGRWRAFSLVFLPQAAWANLFYLKLFKVHPRKLLTLM
jgi:hypothetical protein